MPCRGYKAALYSTGILSRRLVAPPTFLSRHTFDLLGRLVLCRGCATVACGLCNVAEEHDQIEDEHEEMDRKKLLGTCLAVGRRRKLPALVDGTCLDHCSLYPADSWHANGQDDADERQRLHHVAQVSERASTPPAKCRCEQLPAQVEDKYGERHSKEKKDGCHEGRPSPPAVIVSKEEQSIGLGRL
eukprot:scaffold85180_cov23-Tisochrysis_lutea.AAC.1